MRHLIHVLVGLSAALSTCAVASKPDCEWCGAAEAPATLSSTTRIAEADEPGERLQLSGRVFLPDGKTPAADVLIYVYHTNAKGRYPRRGGETGNARRHGYLRGWLLTDAQGHYQIDSIRPGAYPVVQEPAHIHMTVKPPGEPEYWLETLHFVGDPRLGERELNSPGLVDLQQQEDGSWRGVHNIVLKRDSSAFR